MWLLTWKIEYNTLHFFLFLLSVSVSVTCNPTQPILLLRDLSHEVPYVINRANKVCLFRVFWWFAVFHATSSQPLCLRETIHCSIYVKYAIQSWKNSWKGSSCEKLKRMRWERVAIYFTLEDDLYRISIKKNQTFVQKFRYEWIGWSVKKKKTLHTLIRKQLSNTFSPSWSKGRIKPILATWENIIFKVLYFSSEEQNFF